MEYAYILENTFLKLQSKCTEVEEGTSYEFFNLFFNFNHFLSQNMEGEISSVWFYCIQVKVTERGRKELVHVQLNLTKSRFLTLEWGFVNPCLQNIGIFMPLQYKRKMGLEEKNGFPQSHTATEVATTLSQVPGSGPAWHYETSESPLCKFSLLCKIFFLGPYFPVVPFVVLFLVNYICILSKDQDVNLLG